MTFSHTVLVSGFGNSCSQALLAKLPSQMVGSGRISTCSPVRGCSLSGRGLASPPVRPPAQETPNPRTKPAKQRLTPGRLEVITHLSTPEGAQHVIAGRGSGSVSIDRISIAERPSYSG